MSASREVAGEMPKQANAVVPLFKVFMPETVGPALGKTLFCGQIAEGPRVREFEAGLAPWTGTTRVVALNSGTSALHMALHLAGIGPGDEVISTPMTCIATNLPVLHFGGRLVWADIDPASGNIDPDSVRKLVTKRTRAIMVMHWAGYPCDLDAIHAIASEHNLPVIEDACQAFGATFDNKPIGSHSPYVCFSFQAVKTMTTCDGGAIALQADEAADRARLLRWYGMNRLPNRVNAIECQDVVEPGYKFHMNDVAAAIGIEQLKYVGENLARAASNAATYMDAFSGLKHVDAPNPASNRCSSWWQFTLRVRDREQFQRSLQEQGIAASPLHRRNDVYSVFREFARELPGVDAFDREHVCIPVGWWVDAAAADRIVRAVSSYKPA
jgi:perosamine synthetase